MEIDEINLLSSSQKLNYRWLYCVECPQYNIFGWKCSAICAQSVYFLHSTKPILSRDSIVDGNWLPATE